jgi:hypothetical protein
MFPFSSVNTDSPPSICDIASCTVSGAVAYARPDDPRFTAFIAISHLVRPDFTSSIIRGVTFFVISDIIALFELSSCSFCGTFLTLSTKGTVLSLSVLIVVCVLVGRDLLTVEVIFVSAAQVFPILPRVFVAFIPVTVLNKFITELNQDFAVSMSDHVSSAIFFVISDDCSDSASANDFHFAVVFSNAVLTAHIVAFAQGKAHINVDNITFVNHSTHLSVLLPVKSFSPSPFV